jgi:multiple antibiotic resistance protein
MNIDLSQFKKHDLIVSAEIVLVGIIIAILMRLSGKIAKQLGQTGMNIITRVMGLILAAISIEYISLGLKGLFPILAR